MALATASLAKMTGILVVMGLFFLFQSWYRQKMSDGADGEPLLAEEALVHAKSDHISRYDAIYIIHFYIAARDEVVNCEVPYPVWRDLEMKSRGILTHQGGYFCSFESGGVLYCQGGYHVGG